MRRVYTVHVGLSSKNEFSLPQAGAIANGQDLVVKGGIKMFYGNYTWRIAFQMRTIRSKHYKN